MERNLPDPLTTALQFRCGYRQVEAWLMLVAGYKQRHRLPDRLKSSQRQQGWPVTDGSVQNWGIRPPLPVVGLGSRPAQTAGRAPNRARRCRPHSEPGADDRSLVATI